MCVIIFPIVLHGIPEDVQLAETCWIVEIHNLCICIKYTLLVILSIFCGYEVPEGEDHTYCN